MLLSKVGSIHSSRKPWQDRKSRKSTKPSDPDEITYSKPRTSRKGYQPELTRANARSYAVWLLAKGMITSGIMTDKISQKGYAKTDVFDVVAEMQRMGYVNDTEYANVFFRNMIEFKTYGLYGVKMRLQRKKLPSKEIDRVLKKFTEKKETEIALRFAAAHENEAGDALVRMLQYRGFRWPTIAAVLKKQKKNFSHFNTEEIT
jgi:SOS response regulatory protein OraA/RecX